MTVTKKIAGIEKIFETQGKDEIELISISVRDERMTLADFKRMPSKILISEDYMRLKQEWFTLLTKDGMYS